MINKLLSGRGLASKMILLIFSACSFIFLAIFLYNYYVSRDILVRNIEESAENLTNNTVNKVEKILVAVTKVPETTAIVLEGSDCSKEKILRYLRQIVENNDEVFGAAIAFEPGILSSGKYSSPGKSFTSGKYFAPYCYKKDGSIFVTGLESPRYDYTKSDWYQIPKELNRRLWSEPYFDEGGGDILMSTYSVPFYIKSEGKRRFAGIITADISLTWLQKIVSSIKVYRTGYAFLISRSGRIVTHPRKDLIMNESIFSLAEEKNYPGMRQMGRNMIAGKAGVAKFGYINMMNGKASWIAYSPVKVNGWSLGIVYPVDEIMADVNNLNRTVLILGTIGGFFLLLVIVIVSGSITRPLRRLAGAAHKIAEGEFEIQLPEIHTSDEIGNLNRSFIHMQHELRNNIIQLKNAKMEVEEYSRTLEEKVSLRTQELNNKNLQIDEAFRNIKTLSEIGKKITSTLDIKIIFDMVYSSISSLLDATIFLILLYDEDRNMLDCRLSIENGEKLPEFSFSMEDKNRFAVWCVEHKQPVYMNDVDTEYHNYISQRITPKAGTYSSSMIYYPLIVEDRVIGTISVQSYNRNAYTQFHLDIISNLASSIAIALDNAYAYENINRAHNELKEAQAQLVQAEKMASLGQLTAGIAHEIKNPLNFVNNFADLSADLVREIGEEINSSRDKFEPKAAEYVFELLNDLEHNVKKINEHGKRADSIVKGMLLHSRGKSGEMQKTDIAALLREYVNLAYHGYRAQDSTFNVKIEADYDDSLHPMNCVPQNISRVFLNIINNACYSVHEKKKERGDKFSPVLSVSAKKVDGKAEIRIKDNGKGIPQEVLQKIFNPFFTTKPAGKGTGLGLSMSFDIVVQEHKGELFVESEAGEGAEFIIRIPDNL
ncbi:MAG: ATP-binding protein [Bacteroidota bacterium]